MSLEGALVLPYLQGSIYPSRYVSRPTNLEHIYLIIFISNDAKDFKLKFSVNKSHGEGTQGARSMTVTARDKSVSFVNMVLGKNPGSKKTKRSGTSSSVHVHHLYTSRSSAGRSTLKREVLNATAISQRQAEDRVDHNLRQDAMSTAERDELNAIRNDTTGDIAGSLDISNLEHDTWGMDVDAILAGAETMNISHAGGEFASVVEIAEDLLGSADR